MLRLGLRNKTFPSLRTNATPRHPALAAPLVVLTKWGCGIWLIKARNMIICELVEKNNVDLAIRTQTAIFPNESGALNLMAAADKDLIEEVYGKNYRKSIDFWLAKNGNSEIVGITGIYSYVEYPDEAWCAWYGILPEQQGLGYGKALLYWTMDKAREMGFKNFRLYTDLEDNKTATELYRKVGMTEEVYTGEDMGNEKTVIFSISLFSEPVEKFGSKNLFLKKQEEIQKRAKEIVKM